MDIRERFYDKVVKIPFTTCWEWFGKISTKGYGHFSIHGRSMNAHRAAWIIEYGEIPADTFVCHKCDNRSCVKLSHLFLGSNSDNMQDSISKGRFNRAHGTKHGNAKFTDAQVLEIRERWAAGEKRIDIAAMFDTSENTIYTLTRGRVWKHLPVSGQVRSNLGEDHYAVKLNEQQVRMIRISPKSSTELSHELGVSRALIWRIRQRKAWKHIQ